MTIAYVNSQVGQSATDTAGRIAFTLTWTPVAGNALVVVISQGITIGIPHITLSDNAGNAYQQLFAGNTNSNPNFVFVAAGIASRGGLVVTIQYPVALDGVGMDWQAIEFSGFLPGAVALDISAGNFDPTPVAIHSSGSVETRFSNDLILGIFQGGTYNRDTWNDYVAQDGYTLLSGSIGNPTPNTFFGSWGAFAVVYKIVASPGVENPEVKTIDGVGADAPVRLQSMSTVALTNLNIGQSRITLTPIAQGISGRFVTSTDSLVVHAAASVAAVTHAISGMGTAHLVVAASSSAVRIGPVSEGATVTVVIDAGAAGVVIGNKPASARELVLVFTASASAILVPFVPRLAAVGGQGEFGGYASLEEQLLMPLLVVDNGCTPLEPDVAPIYRVHGPDGLMPGVVGASVPVDGGVITAATNSSPVVYTSPNHRLTPGTCVTVSGVLGNLGANGVGLVEVIDDSTFSIPTASGSADYTGGGEWHVTGLYAVMVGTTTVAGFETSLCYSLDDRIAVSGRGVPGGRTFVVT